MITLLGLVVTSSLALSSNATATATATAAATATTKKKDTVLDDQFCQHYYTVTDASDVDIDADNSNSNGNNSACHALRSKIRSEIRGNGTPTLELGNKDKQPAMMFIHGWPDTSALWANQFAEFCGEDKEYFCVAPSWIDFHPDYPLADESKLFWSAQRDDFYAVIQDLELTDITFVIFDFGVIVGAQMVYLYPELFSKVIMMDIPLIIDGVTFVDATKYDSTLIDSLAQYQQNNIRSFLTNDDELMMHNIDTTLGGTSPCSTCRIAPNASFGIGARTGWPYYNFVRTDQPWMKDGFDKDDILSFDEWEFSFIPSFPDNIQILYLYGTDFFQNPKFFEWIDNRNDDSEYVKVNDSDHWLQVRQPTVVNKKISERLIATIDSTADATIAPISIIENGGEDSSSSVTATIDINTDIDISRTHNINNINSSDMESSRLTTSNIAAVVVGVVMMAVVVVVVAAIVVKQNHDKQYSYEKIINEVND